MSADYVVVAVKLAKRRVKAEEFQKLLTKYGCIIRTRLGLHEAGDVCSENGLILLQLVAGAEEIPAFEEELRALDGVAFKTIEL